ncbi:DUF4288 domain-containing protein [Solirubrum puertoriconensis]|uniref:DUF4288 domain-containing protein n=1 Tax=Solirubrum puertoriconensis TaxID=1751427 RepID=A0A9X0L5L6_SOLP1|nr:DUF4288 domain-containing protein [Solirubrum puertoriconensis]KUG08732.1 hypothetical protein ASU33_11380 [Solirubrum puertoriconensis]
MELVEKITNNGNWFIAEIIERTEPSRADDFKEKSSCTVWGNYILIKAGTLAEAYDKAASLGEKYNYTFRNEEGVELTNFFIGNGDLLPVYEDIEDGTEILWTDYGSISARKAKSLVKAKEYWLAKEGSRKRC